MQPPLWVWAAVVAAIVAMLAVDLVAHRNAHVVSAREAAAWSVAWVALGLGFGAIVWAWQGSTAGGEYLAGYLVEKSLAIDNLFVFALLLSYFAVPTAYQHRVLFYGVVGALLLRAGFIAGGAAALDRFHGAFYVFGAVLLVTGVRMATHRTGEVHPERNPVLRLLRRVVPITPDYVGQRFVVRRPGLALTPLAAALVAVETSDVVFAIDSVPAVFAVTDDPFLVFTSNAFAILGLRALYFLLAGLMHRFVYLKVGLGAVLVVVGTKMLLADVVHVPVWLSLAVVAGIVATAVLASLRRTSSTPPPLPHSPTTTKGLTSCTSAAATD